MARMAVNVLLEFFSIPKLIDIVDKIIYFLICFIFNQQYLLTYKYLIDT